MEFKIIKVSYIEEVCDNSAELIREMVDIFSDQVSEFSDSMNSLYQEGKYYDLGLMAHKAKSSVAIMGMDDLAEKLKNLEINAKEGTEPETYYDHINAFKEQTGEALKELETYLKSL
ncbi:MAG: hypothetical protein KFF49_07990 [Bacteroidales bacterium]|nr:hypothetical protein [Bacteroidales bacterium]